MNGFTQTIVMGHLGNDPQMHYFEGGGCVCRISVATTQQWNDKQTNEKKSKTEWHSLVFRNKQAEVIEKYFKKGNAIHAIGKNVTRKWQDTNGQDRFSTEVQCNQFSFMPKVTGTTHGSAVEQYNNKPAETTESNQKDQMSGDDNDDLPF